MKPSTPSVAAVLMSLPGIALAQGATPTPDLSQLVKLVVGLLVVVGVIVLLARVLPRFSGMQQLEGGRFRVVSSLAVGQRERIVLLQVGDRQLMVGVAPGRVNTLHVLDEPLEPAASGRNTVADDRPASWLARTLTGGRR